MGDTTEIASSSGKPTNRSIAIFAAALIFAAYYASQQSGFPLIHILDVMFGSALLFSIFMLTWNAREYLDNGYLQFIGIAFLFVGVLDILSPLQYGNIAAHPELSSDASTQFWISSRLLQAASMLIAPAFLRRRGSPVLLVAFFFGLSALIVAFIFLRLFPAAYVAESGTTLFKKSAEYAVIVIYALSMALLFRHRREFDGNVFRLLLFSMLLAAAETMIFAVQDSPFRESSFIGHYFEILSYYLVYRAVVVTGLMRPYDLLFRNLNRSRELLEKSEKQFRSVAETASDAIVTIRENGEIILWNHGAEEIFGFTAEEVLNSNVCVIIPEDCRDAHRQGLEKAVSLGTRYSYGKTRETIGIRKGGSMVPLEISVSGWSAEGEPFFTAIIRDISSRKRIEDELEGHRRHLEELVASRTSELVAANERLTNEIVQRIAMETDLKESKHFSDQLAESSPYILYLFDLQEQRLTYVNNRIFDITGYSPVYAVSKGRDFFMESIMPEDIPVFSQSVQRYGALNDHEFNETEMRMRHAGGEYRWIHARGSVFARTADGAPRLILGSAQDITERKRAEAALKESEEKLRVIFENASDGILLLDIEDMQLKSCNRSACEMLGYSQDEISCLSVKDIDADGDTSSIEDTIRRISVGGMRLASDVPLKKRDGGIFYADISSSPPIILNNKRHLISIFRDITEKKRLESIAEAANTMNNIGFIFSGIRHEIGNPINSTKMTLSVLRANLESYGKPEIREYLDRALGEIAKIEYLLKSLKNFNMFENPEPQDIMMADFMAKFISLVKSDFGMKGIEVSASVADGAVTCHADPRALQQVLLNIMTNAADACSGQNGARISINVSMDQDIISLDVTDNGKGMSEEEMKDLFKPFFTSKHHGTGLGLVIAKKMISKMHGTISISSTKGAGSRVSIRLPKGTDDASRS